MKSVKCFVRRDAVMRSHKSDALLHRINHDESRVLGSSVWKSFFLPDRLVQPEIRGIHTDGRRRSAYVSKKFVFLIIKKNYFYISILIFKIKFWEEKVLIKSLYMLQSTRHLLSINKRTQTIRPRPSRKKPTNDKSETIVLPPVLSLLKQLINIIIE